MSGYSHEKISTASGTEEIERNKVVVQGRVVAQISNHRVPGSSSSTRLVHYVHGDHQGTTDTITRRSPPWHAHMSYTPWGERRDPQNWTSVGDFDNPSVVDVGFAGHSERDDFGLLHMGARLFDPSMGRFISPDPTIPRPASTDKWNRYSYAFNNPTNYVDRDGYDPTPDGGGGQTKGDQGGDSGDMDVEWTDCPGGQCVCEICFDEGSNVSGTPTNPPGGSGRPGGSDGDPDSDLGDGGDDTNDNSETDPGGGLTYPPPTDTGRIQGTHDDGPPGGRLPPGPGTEGPGSPDDTGGTTSTTPSQVTDGTHDPVNSPARVPGVSELDVSDDDGGIIREADLAVDTEDPFAVRAAKRAGTAVVATGGVVVVLFKVVPVVVGPLGVTQLETAVEVLDLLGTASDTLSEGSSSEPKRDSKGRFTSAAGGNNPANDVGKATHANYPLALGDEYDYKVTLPSGRQPDAVDFKNRVVRELKPDTPKAVARGARQVERYRQELEEVYGGEWTAVVDVYKRPQ